MSDGEFRPVEADDSAEMVRDAFSLWLKDEFDLEELPNVTGMIVAGSFTDGENESFYSFTHGLQMYEVVGMIEWIRMSIERKLLQ